MIVSDLIQNVPGKMDQYREPLSYRAFQSSSYFNEVGTGLANVRVSILYLSRATNRVQGPEHIMFWEQWFADMGATVSESKLIEGGQ